jgi:hypothetical protein
VDDVARLAGDDRSDLFAAAAAARAAGGRSLSREVVEKDFWVCWALRRLFTLPGPPAGPLFKGGTSLSQVFAVVDREDVDLSLDRAALGFGGADDPLLARSGKARRRAVGTLVEACRRAVRGDLLPQLAAWLQGVTDKISDKCAQ